MWCWYSEICYPFFFVFCSCTVSSHRSFCWLSKSASRVTSHMLCTRRMFRTFSCLLSWLNDMQKHTESSTREVFCIKRSDLLTDRIRVVWVCCHRLAINKFEFFLCKLGSRNQYVSVRFVQIHAADPDPAAKHGERIDSIRLNPFEWHSAETSGTPTADSHSNVCPNTLIYH